MNIEQIPILGENYVYLLQDEGSKDVTVIDPGEAAPVEHFLTKHNLNLTHILNTHHHSDHIDGNQALKSKFNAILIGPARDASRIPDMDQGVQEEDTVTVGSQTAQVIDTPGHTHNHISFWFPNLYALFCGDTLFSLGCGRLFEGTPQQMWNSLLKLRALPDETLVYCSHEITQANARFALTIDPENKALQERANIVDKLRQHKKPTIPVPLGIERDTNPFLRADHPDIKKAVDLDTDADPVEVFAALRLRKNLFS